MPAGYSELFLEQGATFNTSITLDDVSGVAFNLVNYTATSQMRKSYYTSSYHTITSTITNAANGEITLSITAANTTNITPGRYVYDLRITSPSNTVTRIVEGIVTVLPSVTR
jgi:hypothetical protein